MRSSIIMSVTLHGAVVVLSVFGLPHIQRDLQIEEDFEKVKSAIKLETRNKID